MKTALLALVWISLSASPAWGQSYTRSLETTLAGNGSQGAGSLAFLLTHASGTSRRFEWGVGLRLTSYIGQNQYYETAPARLTSGQTGPQVIFVDNIINNIDTLLIHHPQVNSLNIYLSFRFRLAKRWHAGFNIDAAGLSWGGSRSGNYINGPSGAAVTAQPTTFNLLLISDNDLGSLNSEFFVHYQFNNTWGIKAGATFLFTEYTTHTSVQTFPEPNDRFRKKSFLPSLGITYTFK
jgi:hypothetical protein